MSRGILTYHGGAVTYPYELMFKLFILNKESSFLIRRHNKRKGRKVD